MAREHTLFGWPVDAAACTHGPRECPGGARYNHKEVVDFLLSRILSRDINAQNNDGSTALHVRVLRARSERSQWWSRCPVVPLCSQFAVARGRSHKAVIEALVQFGASMDVRNANGVSAHTRNRTA